MKLTYFIYLQLTIRRLIKHFTVIYADANKQFLTLNLICFAAKRSPYLGPQSPYQKLQISLFEPKKISHVWISNTFFWNLQQMNEVTRHFCWHQNFVPWELSAPATGLYTYIKSWKKLYKIRLERDIFETCNKWPKWQEVSDEIRNLSPRLYTFIKSWKDVYKVRLKRFFSNLQQMTIVMRPSCWHQNFGPNGLCAPAQGLCLNFFSSITADFNISSALMWAIQDQWSSGYYILWTTWPFKTQHTYNIMLKK